MKLLSKEVDLSVLSVKYDKIRFHMYCSDDPLSFISCIVCVCETSADILENWRTIQNVVSVHYQPSGDLASWNMYIVFFTTDVFPVWEKYEIENNKFAARKIIIDKFSGAPTSAQLVTELQKYLLGTDLRLDPRVNESKEALLSLDKYVRGAPLDSKNESREIRASMVNEIIKFLNKNEN